MTHEEIIAMAREAGGYESPQYPENLVMDEHDLSRFAALVAADEREPLTGEQIAAIWAQKPRYHAAPIGKTDIEFARAIERAHGIGIKKGDSYE